jgi:phage tail-like protein
MALDVYPYKNFRFKVEVAGTMVAGFSDVTGFDATFDVVEYREGDAKDITPRKQPGLVKYSNVVFKRGVISAMDFFDWIEEVHNGKLTVERKTVTVQLCDDEDKVVASWQILKAWPCKYTGPEFKGNGSEIAMESIEFAHEGLVRVKI